MCINDSALIELLHIQLELKNDRTQHMRHFIDQYYCYQNNYVTRNGKAKWEKVVWGVNETISAEAFTIKDRKKVVKEHVIPLKTIVVELTKLPDFDIETISKCLDDLVIFATITKEEDKKLNNLKLRSSMPEEYDDENHHWYKNHFARYLKAGINIAQFSKTHNKIKNLHSLRSFGRAENARPF